jgi:hypothetical protein
MNETIVTISDDSDDEVPTVVYVKQGNDSVIVIDDSDSDITITNNLAISDKPSQPSSPDNHDKSTTQDPNIATKSQSPPKNTKLKSILRKNRVLPLDNLSCSSASSNPNSKSNPSTSFSNDQNKLPSNSDDIKTTGSATDNKSSNPPHSQDREVCYEPTTKRHVSNDPKFRVTIRNNLSGRRKTNLRASCALRAPNKVGRNRRRTQSAPCVAVGKTSNENSIERNSRQCRSVHSKKERGRTKSAPSSLGGKETVNSSWIPGLHNKNLMNSHSTNSSSSTQACSSNSRKRKREKCKGKSPSSAEKIRNETQPKKPKHSSCASTSTLPASSSRQVLSNLQNSNLPTDSLENLSTFSHIIFIDLDNWGKFFSLPYPLPPKVFVWAFCGGQFGQSLKWSVHFRALLQEKRFFQHPKCGTSKNAADFALCVQAARLDLQLPVDIPFTVLSGDKGFGELKSQLKSSARQIHLVDPHREQADILYATLASIGKT